MADDNLGNMLREDRPKLRFTPFPVSLAEETAELQLARRALREPLSHESIEYEFTHDRALLHQYYQIREVMYRKVFNTEKFVGKEDVYDKLSHVLIARRDKLCVGGARITVREPDEEFLLPMESEDFNLHAISQVKPYCAFRHCEISRFAILSDKFEKEVMERMVKELIAKMASLGVHYLFVKANAAMVRNWRKMANLNELLDNHIFSDIEIPENPIHPGVKWYLLRITVIPPQREAVPADTAYLTTVQ